MAKIELSAADRELATDKLQNYLATELDIELGAFQVQFLLDFFSEQIAWQYYNQGLADALQAIEKKIEEVADTIYELEMQEPEST